MFRPRIIPVLLLKDEYVVKSVQFKKHNYIGDPINCVRIFNNLQADELVFLDIEASKQNRLISLDFIRNVGEEAHMPFAVGGGIRSLKHIQDIIAAGAEKVIICSYALENPDFIKEASETFGSSTVAVCIDVKKKLFGKKVVWGINGSKSYSFSAVEFAQLMEQKGAGEIIIQSIEQDGTMQGYDLDLISSLSEAVSIPVIALGGAGSEKDLVDAHHKSYANGVAAGSLFIYQGAQKGVLITYPKTNSLFIK